MTIRYATEPEARAYYAGDDAEPLDVSVVRGAAARAVASLSKPEHDEDGNVTLEYAEAAKEAELLVGRWIWTSDHGTLTSKSISGVISKNYSKVADVQALVSLAMGEYASGSSDVGYISTFPKARG